MRVLLAAALGLSFVACSAGEAPVADAPRDGVVELFQFKDRAIGESSGVATASYRDDVLFTHNDSGDEARFFAVDFSGETLATYTIVGAKAVDWEDMARGPRSDGTPGQSLYFGDIGNNVGARDVHDIYEVDEPVVGRAPTQVRVRNTIRVRYPDGRHNAEALLVHPRTGQIVLVTKEVDGPTQVYARTNGALVHVTEVGGDAVTGGAFSPSGDRLVLRTYQETLEWRLDGDSLAASLVGEPVATKVLDSFQSEAVTYTNDGRSLIVTSEGPGAPVHRIPSAFGA